MRIYLVQHGNAVSREHDPNRPLSARGREDVKQLAERMRRAAIHIARVEHSDKLRAKETAKIFARSLSPSDGTQAAGGLSPARRRR